MNEETDLAVLVARLEERVNNLIEQQKARATREWAMILSGLGLVATIFAKTLGLV